ncbi:MAG: sigma-70 family RNA polymerase sigma factor [Verrucomicrobiota bacterium]
METDTSHPSESDFAALFVQHETAFRAYARSLLPTWDAVDEVIQTASLVMWRKLDQVDLPDGFLPWGKVVVRFEAQKYCRTKARDGHVFDPDLLDLLATAQDEEAEPDWTREQAALDHCLSQVSDATRQLVFAPYQGHGFLTELAEASGRTRNSLYKQIRRIRGKLEQCVLEQLAQSPQPPSHPS